jgi:nicotinamidase-related amidase
MLDRPQFARSHEGGRRALAAARQHSMTIVHVPCVFNPGYPEIGGGLSGGLFRAIPKAGTWTAEGGQFAVGFEPLPGEFVVGGRVGASAFAHSNLDVYLRTNQISTLYLGGYALHVCVESTLRHGHDLGYDMHVLEDASAAFTTEQRRHVLDDVVHHYGHHLSVDAFIDQLQASQVVMG